MHTRNLGARMRPCGERTDLLPTECRRGCGSQVRESHSPFVLARVFFFAGGASEPARVTCPGPSRPLTAAVRCGGGRGLSGRGTAGVGVLVSFLLGSGLPEGAVGLPVTGPRPVAASRAPRRPPVGEGGGSHCGGVSSEARRLRRRLVEQHISLWRDHPRCAHLGHLGVVAFVPLSRLGVEAGRRVVARVG